MRYVLLFSLLGLAACSPKGADSPVSISSLSCKGIYYERDSSGNLKKFNQYAKDGQCWTENKVLSQWEKTSEKWTKTNTTCTPQPGFSSRTVVAANNFYTYRDGKSYMDFDGSTGIYRRLILAEKTDGSLAFTKLQGCFYQRTATGVDAAFGKQLLLDTDINHIVTSQYFDPMEIFNYTEVGNDLNMLRFDDSNDWDYRFCPVYRTPWSFCNLIRNGNEMYFPILSASQMTDLRDEALLIRKQFNYTKTNKASFETLWSTVAVSRKENMREDYLYDVVQIPDVPRYIDQAWRDYVMNNRPTMPDVTSNTSISTCYHGSKSITYADGSTGKVFGEVCYSNGVYSFTQ